MCVPEGVEGPVLLVVTWELVEVGGGRRGREESWHVLLGQES